MDLHQTGGTEVVAVLQRSVATAIAAFDKLRVTLVALAAFSLVLSVAGSIAISRGITRPLSQLVGAAVRIQKGDYAAEVAVARDDEIGVLASSLDDMRSGIALREQEILRLAYRDGLTGLPNRVLFNLRLEEDLAIAAKICFSACRIDHGPGSIQACQRSTWTRRRGPCPERGGGPVAGPAESGRYRCPPWW